MAKKKEIVQSVALFDEEPVVSKKTKQEAPKQTSSTSKKEVKPKTSKLSKETKSSPKKKETKKTTKKNDNSNDNTNRNSLRGRDKTGNRNSSTKKESKETGGTKSKRASDTPKKSRVNSKSDTKSTASNKRTAKKSVDTDKLPKKSVSKRTTRRDKKDSVRSTEASVADGREKQASVNEVSTDLAAAKKHKHIFTRGTEIWPPKQITGKPKSIKDGELLAIVVDGEYLEVSPWSVKDGIYRQGLDGNFLVKYLHYETVSTKYDASNEQLSNIVKKKERK